MNKKMRELLSKMELKLEQAKGFREDGVNKDLDKAKELMDEAKELQKEYELEKEIFEMEKKHNTPDDNELEKKQQDNKNKDVIKEFADAARNGFKVNKKMNETTPADGGYTVPEDISTQIQTYRESKFSLQDLVTVEPVKREKGSRTFKKRTQQTGFVKVGEGGKIPKKDTPKFERLSYEIEKYAGFFPVTNELLEDTDANIVQTLIAWIGDESRVTRNKVILETIKTKDKTELTNVDDIKKAINVTLGSAFKNTSAIVTNDDGYQYLDTLKDADGNYLLQPSIREGSPDKIFNLPLKVVPNSDLPSDTSTSQQRKIPFIIGDLKEGIVFFDRNQISIKSSDVASTADLNAFEEDLTLWRAIEREDCKVKDSDAFVNGEITIEDTSVVGLSSRKK